MERRREAVAGPMPFSFVRSFKALGAVASRESSLDVLEKAVHVISSISEAGLLETRESRVGRKVPCLLGNVSHICLILIRESRDG